MVQFHQIYLRLISLVALLTLTSAIIHADCLTEALGNDSIHPLSVCMDTERGGFCGLFIMEKQDNIIKGSLFNEFGITAYNFEFNIRNGKIKLYDVISFLNKWYIKKIIKGDMEYLFRNELLDKKSVSRGRELVTAGEKVVLRNLKYHIGYTFSNINTNETIE